MTTLHEATLLPLHKLVRSAKNVRRTAPTARIEELAASIATHGLLHPLIVEPLTNKKDKPTGKYGVIAGGRRLAALQLLVEQGKLGTDDAVPCVLWEDNCREVSLAENVGHAPMHPADQYEAFAALHAEGMTAADIAARFGLSARTVEQRLRLGAVSPRLLAAYREGEMSLEQLMAYGVTDDHTAQERVWELRYPSAYSIRQALTEGQVPTTDRRAVFVGVEAYEKAGGIVLQDLFSQADGGGYITDLPLLQRLVDEKLQQKADELKAEGWKWVAAAVDYDHGAWAHHSRVWPVKKELTDEEQEQLEALQAEWDNLEGNADDYNEQCERLNEAMDLLEGEEFFTPEAKARSGVVLSLNHDGTLSAEGGMVRPEDLSGNADTQAGATTAKLAGGTAEGGLKPLSRSLLTDLSAWKTAALREALGHAPDLALRVVTHSLVVALFPCHGNVSCLEIRASCAPLDRHAKGIEEGRSFQVVAERQEDWQQLLPKDPEAVWGYLLGLPEADLMDLFAHCVSLTVNALNLGGYTAPQHRHAAQLAAALSLDLTKSWEPTAKTYFGRVSKERILEAVTEGAGEEAARQLSHLKKGPMAEAAATRLHGTGWLPKELRMPQGGEELPTAA